MAPEKSGLTLIYTWLIRRSSSRGCHLELELVAGFSLSYHQYISDIAGADTKIICRDVHAIRSVFILELFQQWVRLSDRKRKELSVGVYLGHQYFPSFNCGTPSDLPCMPTGWAAEELYEMGRILRGLPIGGLHSTCDDVKKERIREFKTLLTHHRKEIKVCMCQ